MITDTREVSIDVLLSLHRQMKNSLHELEKELMKVITLWQSKAEFGFHVQAVMQYREENKCTLAEAKEAVDSFLLNNNLKK